MEREQLIAHCEKALVTQDNWSTPDTYYLQKQVGELWSYLKAGCNFKVFGETEQTLKIEVEVKGRDFFKWGIYDTDVYVIPTESHLSTLGGADWC